jgi:hypothetical protein
MASLDPSPGYSHADPFDSGFLAVGLIHTLYYEQYGKRDGRPGRIDKYLFINHLLKHPSSLLTRRTWRPNLQIQHHLFQSRGLSRYPLRPARQWKIHSKCRDPREHNASSRRRYRDPARALWNPEMAFCIRWVLGFDAGFSICSSAPGCCLFTYSQRHICRAKGRACVFQRDGSSSDLPGPV